MVFLSLLSVCCRDYHGSNSGIPAAVHVEDGQTVTVDTITIAGKLPESAGDSRSRADVSPSKKNRGRVVSVDDASFLERFNMILANSLANSRRR
jgi:hypothetical protein